MALQHIKSLPIRINWTSRIPAYAQVADRINCIITAGQLSEGDLLPQIRKLAVQLDANPNTVARAYDELERRGLLHKRQGSGCYVARPKRALKSGPERFAPLRPRIEELIADAQSLGISPEEMAGEIRRQASSLDGRSTLHSQPPVPRATTRAAPGSPETADGVLWRAADTLID